MIVLCILYDFILRKQFVFELAGRFLEQADQLMTATASARH